jgi:phosphoglycerol transferase
MKYEVPRRPGNPISWLDIGWCTFGGFFSFVMASILVSGWPDGLFPRFNFPFVYGGDGVFSAWAIQRIIEGSLWINCRSGFPFCSNFLDFPGSDTGSILGLKLLSYLVDGWAATLNLYFLIGFPLAFIVSYPVLRSFGLNQLNSFAGSFLFTFLPFHVWRIPHLFYTWYFTAPIFYWISYRLFCGEKVFLDNRFGALKNLFIVLIIFALASFGIYYALFGMIMIAVGLIGGQILSKHKRFLLQSIIILVMLVGVIANVMPTLINDFLEGKNPEVAQRSPAESEIYALKLRQLVLPRVDHQSEVMASLTKRYTVHALAGYYEWSAPLGLIGAIGFIGLGFSIIWALSGGLMHRGIKFLALEVWILFLFGTIGGLGALFAGFITPSIRAWDRISIFIGFGAICGALLFYQSLIERFKSRKIQYGLLILGFFGFIFLGIWDQNTPSSDKWKEINSREYWGDREFIGLIEKNVPPDSSIYQLPYMAFPEQPDINQMPSYSNLIGFIQSKRLKWNLGGMKGRDGDLFYRALSMEPLSVQLDVIQRLGFAGIYIDKRGFADQGVRVISELSTLLGHGPDFLKSNNQAVFFKLSDFHGSKIIGRLSNYEISRLANYTIPDELGVRSQRTLNEGIDFSQKQWPIFVKNVSGLSTPELNGRWSDARLDPRVAISLATNFPNKFFLKLSLTPFGPNTDQIFRVKIGSHIKELFLKAGQNSFELPFDLMGEKASKIEFFPFMPVSPSELGVSADPRKLGVMFDKLSISEE